MITVFVGTYNRLETLKRTVASYKRFRTSHELVIVDNGSTHPKCVALLDSLEESGAVKGVYRLPGCVTYPETTANFNLAMRDQVERGDAGEWFAVTEADVSFEGANRGALAAYLRLAQETGRAVGPHLRVGPDIPTGYPLRSRVLACETWMYYRADMQWFDGIPFSDTQIDTTFHLFPAAREFQRLRMNPLRVGPPFDAAHLDWHMDALRPTRESWILVPDDRPLGSWGKSWIRDYWLWFQDAPVRALERLHEEPLNDHGDLCNVSFMLSWAYQYGRGCDVDLAESVAWLRAAIPEGLSRYWEKEEDWMRMIYHDDFSCLGWEESA